MLHGLRCRWVIQYWLLWKRAFFATLRNPAECAIRLLMSTWVSMFAGKRAQQ